MAGHADTAVLLPFAAGSFAYIALAEAWNVLGGLSGQMSLGVGAFVGTGAYAMALVMDHLGWSWLPGLVAATLGAGILSALLARPLLRLHGDYFAVGTLAAGLALEAWVNNWTFAGGSSGISVAVGSVPSLRSLYTIGLVVAFIAVASTIVLRPGSILPSASAASIIATPIRSFTEPPGLRYSTLASTLACFVTRCNRTSGVLPMICVSESYTCMPLPHLRSSHTVSGATVSGATVSGAVERCC